MKLTTIDKNATHTCFTHLNTTMTAWGVDSLTIKKIIQDCKKGIVHIYELFGNGARSESGQIINIQRDILIHLQDIFDKDPLDILHRIDGLSQIITYLDNNTKPKSKPLEGTKDYIFNFHHQEFKQGKTKKEKKDLEEVKKFIQLARSSALDRTIPNLDQITEQSEAEKQAKKEASEKRVKNQIYEQILYKIYTYLYHSKESIEHNITKINNHYQEFVQRYGKNLADIELIDIKYVFKSPAQLLYHLNDEDADMRTKIFKIFKPNTQLFEIDYGLLLYSTRLCIQHPQYVQTFFNFSINMCHEFGTNQELSPESDRQQAYQSVRDTITYISGILFNNNYTDTEINNHLNILKLHISKNSDDYYRNYDKIPVIKKVSDIIRIAGMDKLDSYSQNDQESIIKICTEIEEIDKESYNKQIKEYSNQYHTIANQLSSYNKNCLNNIIFKASSKRKIIEKISTIDKESLIFAIQFINDLLSINKEVDYDNIYGAISQDNIIVAKLKNIYKEDSKNYIFVERIYQYCKSQGDMDNFLHYINKCLNIQGILNDSTRLQFISIISRINLGYILNFINKIITSQKPNLIIGAVEFQNKNFNIPLDECIITKEIPEYIEKFINYAGIQDHIHRYNKYKQYLSTPITNREEYFINPQLFITLIEDIEECRIQYHNSFNIIKSLSQVKKAEQTIDNPAHIINKLEQSSPEISSEKDIITSLDHLTPTQQQELIQKLDQRYRHMHSIGAKLHVDATSPSDMSKELQKILKVGGFKMIHADTCYNLPPTHTPDELIAILTQLGSIGVFNDKKPQLQTCHPGRIHQMPGLLGVYALMMSRVNTQYSCDAFSPTTNYHKELTRSRILAFDAGVYNPMFKYNPKDHIGRIDVLGNQDITIPYVNHLVGNLLSQAQYGGPLQKLGEEFIRDSMDILAKYHMDFDMNHNRVFNPDKDHFTTKDDKDHFHMINMYTQKRETDKIEQSLYGNDDTLLNDLHNLLTLYRKKITILQHTI